MKSRLPWILFFISLAVNISVAVGFIYMHKMGDRPMGKEIAQELIEELKLDESQQAALATLQEKGAARSEDWQARREEWNILVLQVLEVEVYDPEVLRTALIERSQPIRDTMIQSMSDVHEFLKVLNAEQRAAFLKHVEEDDRFLRDLLRPERDRDDKRGG